MKIQHNTNNNTYVLELQLAGSQIWSIQPLQYSMDILSQPNYTSATFSIKIVFFKLLIDFCWNKFNQKDEFADDQKLTEQKS